MFGPRKKGLSAKERLYDLLGTLITAYQKPAHLKEKILTHCEIIEGDLSDDLNTQETISDHIKHPIDYFWHIAASLNSEERYRDEIFATNVGGTRYAIHLAKKLNVKNFHYFSTAYVAGNKGGTIFEDIDTTVTSSNAYEESKVQAEQLVASTEGMHYRIFRPSIVIGHNQTFEAINFTGLYGFLRRLMQFKGLMNRVQKDYLTNHPIKMCVEESTLLNLIPIDMVTDQAVKIGLSERADQIYHLTNEKVPTVGEALQTLFNIAGLMPPEFVDSTESFSWIDNQFNEKIEFYNSYLKGGKTFDRTKTNSALGTSNHDAYAITENTLKKHGQWYLDQLAGQRKTVPTSR